MNPEQKKCMESLIKCSEVVDKLWRIIDLCEEALDDSSSCIDGYYLPKGEAHLPSVKIAYEAIEEARS